MKTNRRDAGFSLAALIFFTTAASIFIAAAVPAYQMQAKRELEEELIFRGEEYTRAIQKYQRKFGVYPNSIDQLVSTNNLRFVRRAYKDPITGKDFRLISINPDGSVTGSKLFTQNVSNQPLFGNTQQFGQRQTNPTQPGQQQQQQQFQPQQRGQQQFQQQQQQFQQFQQLFQQQQRGQQQQTQQQFGQQQQQPQRGQQQGGTTNPFTPLTNIGGTGNGTPVVASGGIIGVASDSGKESIKVYNNRQKYDEWEFIAILGQPGQPGQQQNPQNQQPGQRQNNPFQTPPASPFGGQPSGTPFGPGGGQRQIQQPFGFGNPPGQQNQPGKLP